MFLYTTFLSMDAGKLCGTISWSKKWNQPDVMWCNSGGGFTANAYMFKFEDHHPNFYLFSIIQQPWKKVSCFMPPGFPGLQVCVHNNHGWQGTGKDWEHLSHEWCQVDVRRRGRGVQLPKQCTGSSIRVVCRSFGLHKLAWWILLVWTGKKLAFNLVRTYLNISLSPPSPLTWWMLRGLPHSSPVFHSCVV